MSIRRSRGSKRVSKREGGASPPKISRTRDTNTQKQRENTPQPVLDQSFHEWIFERAPGTEYRVEPSRKLFGKQRYGLAKVKPRPGVVDRKSDFATKEKAEAALTNLNLYAEVWRIYESGDMSRIKKMDLIIMGDKPEDRTGYSNASILGAVVNSSPAEVYKAYKATEKTPTKPKKARAHQKQLTMCR